MSQTNSKVKDPVCGMTIDASSAAATQEWQGKVHHFCSTHCAAKFKSAPERYVAPSPQAQPSPPVR